MRCLLLTFAIVVSPVTTVASHATLRHQAGPPDVAAMLAGATELILADSVSQHGLTRQFAEKVRAGRFVNGDYYVVGLVTIAAITPRPQNGGNGSVLNVPPAATPSDPPGRNAER